MGLLQVADGALSQVTNLLNRAVTLATEASNGTLNGSQDTAANQEYQSILSEINNIGSTTTYNDNAVFGSNTSIYTGDSSTTGASIDALNIRSLSSANVGDTQGTMAYSTSGSTGASDVFINSGAAGSGSTVFNAAAKTITFNSVSAGGVNATTVLKTTAGETLQQVAAQITNAGLGLTATVSSAQAAGIPIGASAPDVPAADQGYEGIMITGSVGLNNGVNTPSDSVASYSGSLSAGATSVDGDFLSGSITFQDGTNQASAISMQDVATFNNEALTAVTNTQLSGYINADAALGVTSSDTSGVLAFTSTGGTGNALHVASNLTDTTTNTAAAYTSTAAFNTEVTATGAGTLDAGAQLNTTATATISYSDAAGTNLSGTDLSNQADAQAALNSLNSAISHVAAQDGYVGAQINTLNSVSSVLSTQQQNVVAAQNAVQATDYATAASNMSKYQILSQTGISALAQANSMQQEVTKLLQ